MILRKRASTTSTSKLVYEREIKLQKKEKWCVNDHKHQTKDELNRTLISNLENR